MKYLCLTKCILQRHIVMIIDSVHRTESKFRWTAWRCQFQHQFNLALTFRVYIISDIIIMHREIDGHSKHRNYHANAFWNLSYAVSPHVNVLIGTPTLNRQSAHIFEYMIGSFRTFVWSIRFRFACQESNGILEIPKCHEIVKIIKQHPYKYSNTTNFHMIYNLIYNCAVLALRFFNIIGHVRWRSINCGHFFITTIVYGYKLVALVRHRTRITGYSLYLTLWRVTYRIFLWFQKIYDDRRTSV